MDALISKNVANDTRTPNWAELLYAIQEGTSQATGRIASKAGHFHETCLSRGISLPEEA
jgi:hypothetical protein